MSNSVRVHNIGSSWMRTSLAAISIGSDPKWRGGTVFALGQHRWWTTRSRRRLQRLDLEQIFIGHISVGLYTCATLGLRRCA